MDIHESSIVEGFQKDLSKTKKKFKYRHPRPRMMKYVNREKCRDVGRLRNIITHMNNNLDEHFMLVVSSPDTRKHLSFFGSKPLIRAALSSQFRSHIVHEMEEPKESIYIPYIRDIGGEEIDNLSESQLGVGINHVLDLFNYPMKQHFLYKKTKQEVKSEDHRKPKPQFWHPMIRFVNFQATHENELIEPEFVGSIFIENKKDAMKMVFSYMLQYYKKLYMKLYNDEKADDEIDLSSLNGIKNVEKIIENDECDDNLDEDDDELINVDDSEITTTDRKKKSSVLSHSSQLLPSSSSHANRKMSAILTVTPPPPAAVETVVTTLPCEDNDDTISISDDQTLCPAPIDEEVICELTPGPCYRDITEMRNVGGSSQARPFNTIPVYPNDSLFKMVGGLLRHAPIEPDGTVEAGTDGKLYRYHNGSVQEIFRIPDIGVAMDEQRESISMDYDHSYGLDEEHIDSVSGQTSSTQHSYDDASHIPDHEPIHAHLPRGGFTIEQRNIRSANILQRYAPTSQHHHIIHPTQPRSNILRRGITKRIIFRPMNKGSRHDGQR